MKTVVRVLIAEDDDHLREAFREALTLEGFMVQVATDAREACRVVEEDPPDAVISDVHMAGDGRTVARLAQKHHVPVILMSGVDEPRAREEAMAAGAFEYLTKPVGIDQIRAVLNCALGRARKDPG